MIGMLKGALTADSSSYTMELNHDKGPDAEDDEYSMVERVSDSLHVIVLSEDPDYAQINREPCTSAAEASSRGMIVDQVNNAGSNRPMKVSPPRFLQAPSRVPALYPNSSRRN